MLMKKLVAKGPSTVNNALFVGSTADLAKLIKSESLKKTEINIIIDGVKIECPQKAVRIL